MRLLSSLSLLVLVLVLASACTPARESWRQAVPQRQEVLVEVLPQEAEVRVRGEPVGVGTRPVEVGPEPTPVQVMAAGFEKAELRLTAQQAGTRVGVALRPIGFGAGRALDLDDPLGLSSASSALLRQGKVTEALQYAERAVEIAPKLGVAHRSLGLALLKAPPTRRNRDRAVQELSAYLTTAGDAADRRHIERVVEGLRGDISINPRQE
jgi:tetratricopeptide (TPR) repeat protein